MTIAQIIDETLKPQELDTVYQTVFIGSRILESRTSLDYFLASQGAGANTSCTIANKFYNSWVITKGGSKIVR